MPASTHFSRSPFIACAVMAIMGVCLPVIFSRSRIAARGLQTVHQGQFLHIDQYEIECAFSYSVNRLDPICGHCHPMASLLQYCDSQLTINGVVFRQQHAPDHVPLFPPRV